MNYLITGGAGFIGSHLSRALLDNGHQVTILDDFSTGKREHLWQGSRCIMADASDSEAVTAALSGCDGVFHLAAIASVDISRSHWRDTTNANLMTTVTIFDAISALASPIPCVYASSAAIYGDNDNVPLNEGATARPSTAYGVDKYASELHARIGCLIHNIPSSGMRFFNVYGPRQDPASPYSGVISIFGGTLLQQQDITIFGDGTQSRDFIYVKDVIAHLMAAMNNHHHTLKASAHIYNVCSGKETTISELADTLKSLTHSHTPSRFEDARVGDVYRSLGDNTQAKEHLGITSSTPLKEGLELTLRWMQQSFETTAQDT